MSNKRIEAAVEAAAQIVHMQMGDKAIFSWERSPDAWRKNLRDIVRPVVEAVIQAVDTHDRSG